MVGPVSADTDTPKRRRPPRRRALLLSLSRLEDIPVVFMIASGWVCGSF
jgi:hypothetical protein